MTLFQETNILRKPTLVTNNLQFVTPKVFCEVERYGKPILVPCSNAVEIVLQLSITERPSLDELERLLKTNSHA